MKLKAIFFVASLIPLGLGAQTFPLGKSKSEVREYRATIPHSAASVSQSDTCDVYQIGELMREYYYYKNNLCYKSKQIYSLLPIETFNQAVASMRSNLDHHGLHKVSENRWTTKDGTEQMELIILEKENKYAVQISSTSDKN
jgi:hypothetical protein